MSWTQSDLDALDAAIKSPVLTVRFADRTVTYRSMNELIMARNLARDSIQASAGTATPRASYVRSSKG
jgi:hypothetical protein